MENWIEEQVARNSRSFDAAMLNENPDAQEYTLDPERYFERVCLQCNYLDAVKALDWAALVPPGARVLDLAGGTGWLTAFLSSMANVREITIVDASRSYLEKNLPVAVRRLAGNAQKIKPAVGYFSPLLFDDSSLDLVVVSSSLHHADCLESVLKEIHRVLMPGGRCLILNEAPVGDLFYLRMMIVTFIRSLACTLSRRYVAVSPSLSGSGILYDPVLGDRMYPRWYWTSAISAAGFRLAEVVDTKLPTVKNGDGLPLVHFVCAKPAG